MEKTLFFLILLLVPGLLADSQQSVQCDVCVEFFNQALNQIIQIIEEVGVLGTCAEVCSALPNQYLAVVCDILCEIEGIEYFSDLVNYVDPDPVWICMSLHACSVNPNAAAKITAVTVSPNPAQRGEKVQFMIEYTVSSTIGTGDVALEIDDAQGEGFPVDGDFLQYDKAPGSYVVKGSFKTTPTQYNPWEKGQYIFTAWVCEGPCGCTHSSCFTLSTLNTTFSISG